MLYATIMRIAAKADAARSSPGRSNRTIDSKRQRHEMIPATGVFARAHVRGRGAAMAAGRAARRTNGETIFAMPWPINPRWACGL